MQIFEGFTVDPTGSRDLDDAILVERDGSGWTVRVAVPRIGAVVPRGCAEDVTARERGWTEYRLDANRPMLPHRAERRLSLTSETDKDALLATMRLDAAGTVVETGYSRVIFRSAGQLTYHAATEALADGSRPLSSRLRVASDLARVLETARASAGAVGARDLGDGWTTDEEGQAVRAGSDDVRVAQALVREIMILTNSALAAYCAQADLPVLFRNHRAKSVADRASLLEDILTAGHGAAARETVAKRLAFVSERARVHPTCRGHWALNLPAYAWFTSPLRRYADLVNQRILEAYVEGLPPPYDLDELVVLADDLNTKADAVREGQAERLREEAERLARRRISQGDVSGVDATGFKRIVKVSTAGEMPDHVFEEATRRLTTGTLTPKEVFRLLLAGEGMARVVVDHAARAPHVSTSVLTHATQASGWKVTYDDRDSGPPHERTFRSRCTVETQDGTFESRWVEGPTKKVARQLAGVDAMARLSKVDSPVTGGHVEAPRPVPVRETVVQPTHNPRNALQELCQSRRWTLPDFTVDSAGPPHSPTFSAVVRVTAGGRVVTSTPTEGRTRKEAEKAACAVLLGMLSRDG